MEKNDRGEKELSIFWHIDTGMEVIPKILYDEGKRMEERGG